MPEFNLDELKSSWQQENKRQRYTDDSILEMINKRSKSYLRNIFCLSLIELTLTFGGALYYLFGTQEEDSITRILMRLGAKNTMQLQMNLSHTFFLFKIICLLVAFIFAFLFYRSYKKINLTTNLRTLTTSIIAFRKTTATLFAANCVLVILMICALAGLSNHELAAQHIALGKEFTLKLILAAAGIATLTALLFYVYFWLTYGKMVRKLNAILAELHAKEADSN